MDEVLTELKDELEKACKVHGFVDPEDVRLLVKTGRLGMLVAIVDNDIKGAAFYEFMRYPKRRTLNIVNLVGKRGSFSKWSKEIVEKLKEIAVASECSHVTSEGRRGWLSVARKLGFETMQRTALVMEVTHGRHEGRRRSGNGDAERAVGSSTAASTQSH